MKFYEHITTDGKKNKDGELVLKISVPTTEKETDYVARFRELYDRDQEYVDKNNEAIKEELAQMETILKDIVKNEVDKKEGEDFSKDKDILKERIENLKKNVIEMPEYTFKVVKTITRDVDGVELPK